MPSERLNLSVELLQAIAALSHVLSWKEFRTYTTILSYAARDSLSARVNQDELCERTGYSPSTIKRHVKRFRLLDLMYVKRGPAGSNYYWVTLPLSSSVVQAIRERIPKFGEVSIRRNEGRTSSVQNVPNAPEEENSMPEPIPTDTITVAVHPAPTSLEPVLDVQISTLLDTLERRGIRNVTTRFLMSQGFISPQLASDQKIVVDRDGLLSYLLEREANDVKAFCALIQELADRPHDLPPSIDIPFSDQVMLHLHYKLDAHPCGMKWLRKQFRNQHEDFGSIPEREIRQSLLEFMRENDLHTLDQVIAVGADKHREIVGKPKMKSVATQAVPVDLQPGELSCKQIVERFVTDDLSWSQKLVVGQSEQDLYRHCSEKFEREHAHVTRPMFRQIQRETMLTILMIVGRQDPMLVGYQVQTGVPNECDSSIGVLHS